MRFLRTLGKPKDLDLAQVEAKSEAIKKIAEEHGLALLYIYGSLAKNKMGGLSDVDVAAQKKDGQKLALPEILALTGRLQKLFQREDIDLVDLNEAPPLLRMRILQSGYLVYTASPSDRARFSYKTTTDYLATSWLRKSSAEYLRKAVGIR